MKKTLNKYSRNIGNFLLVTGVLHLIVGFLENWNTTIDIMRSGVLNTVDETPERLSFFWFQMTGLFVLLADSFLQQYLKENKRPIPRKYGYYFLIIAIIGCALEPVSGFYVFIPISFLIIVSGDKKFFKSDTAASKALSNDTL